MFYEFEAEPFSKAKSSSSLVISTNERLRPRVWGGIRTACWFRASFADRGTVDPMVGVASFLAVVLLGFRGLVESATVITQLVRIGRPPSTMCGVSF